MTRILLVCVIGYLIALVEGRSHPNKKFCKNELSYKDCKFYRDMGFCKTHAQTLHISCPMTCGLCDYGVKNKEVCNDKDGIFTCRYLKENGVCKTHPHLMADRCAKTCNLCGAKRKCKDKKCPKGQVCVMNIYGHAQCQCPRYCPYKEHYKKLGKVCASNAKTYKDFCHMQSHACREQKDLRVLFYGKCIDEVDCEDGKQESESGSCVSWKKYGLCKKKLYASVMRKYCKKTCGFCEGKIPDPRTIQNCTNTRFGCCWDGTPRPDSKYAKCKECVDRFPSFCATFINQCDSVNQRNLEFMTTNCPATCGFCRPDKPREVEIQIFNGSGVRLYTTKYEY